MTKAVRSFALTVLCCAFATAEAKPVPNLKFQDLSGQTQGLGSLRGTVTVVSFWATWCAPCKEELPRLSKLKERYAASDVRFIAISVDEPKDRAKIKPYLAQQPLTFDVWVGADLDTLDRLNLGNVLPATMVLDKDGEIVGRIMGEAQDQDVTGYVDWLLHGREGARPEAVLKSH